MGIITKFGKIAIEVKHLNHLSGKGRGYRQVCDCCVIIRRMRKKELPFVFFFLTLIFFSFKMISGQKNVFKKDWRLT